MLSTIVVTAEPSNITLETTNVVYNEGVVTVTGTIDVPETDVTILAVRTTSSTGITLANAAAGSSETVTDKGNVAWSTAMLQQQVVYIDQETATEATENNFEFSFIPRTGVGGQYITVFVGGANVETPKAVTIQAAPAVPKIAPATPWYQGDTTVAFALTKDDEAKTPWTQTAANEWWSEVDTITVDGTDVSAGKASNWQIGGTADAALLVYTTDAATISSVSFVDGDALYPNAGETFATAQGRDPRPTPELDDADPIVAGGTASFAIKNLHATYGQDWVDAVDTTTVSATNGTVLSADATNEAVTVAIDIDDSALTKDVTVTVNVGNYTPVDATVTVEAPTKADADDTTIPATSYGSEFYALVNGETEYPADATLKNQKYGHVLLDLSALTSGTNGSTITWTVVEKGTENAITPADGVYDLTRSESSEKVYTVTGTVEKTGYAPATVSKDITVGQIGIAGVNVSVKLAGGAAKDAVVKLMNGDSEVATLAITGTWQADAVGAAATEWTFAAANVTAGTYDLVISRPGYLTRTIEDVVVGNEDAAFGTKTLLFGDNRGMISEDADGVIDLSDYDAIVAAVLISTDLKYDANGDGVVDLGDYDTLVSNVLQSYATVQD